MSKLQWNIGRMLSRVYVDESSYNVDINLEEDVALPCNVVPSVVIGNNSEEVGESVLRISEISSENEWINVVNSRRKRKQMLRKEKTNIVSEKCSISPTSNISSNMMTTGDVVEEDVINVRNCEQDKDKCRKNERAITSRMNTKNAESNITLTEMSEMNEISGNRKSTEDHLKCVGDEWQNVVGHKRRRGKNYKKSVDGLKCENEDVISTNECLSSKSEVLKGKKRMHKLNVKVSVPKNKVTNKLKCAVSEMGKAKYEKGKEMHYVDSESEIGITLQTSKVQKEMTKKNKRKTENGKSDCEYSSYKQKAKTVEYQSEKKLSVKHAKSYSECSSYKEKEKKVEYQSKNMLPVKHERYNLRSRNRKTSKRMSSKDRWEQVEAELDLKVKKIKKERKDRLNKSKGVVQVNECLNEEIKKKNCESKRLERKKKLLQKKPKNMYVKKRRAKAKSKSTLNEIVECENRMDQSQNEGQNSQEMEAMMDCGNSSQSLMINDCVVENQIVHGFSNKLIEKLNEGCNYTCCSCKQLFFKKSVVKIFASKLEQYKHYIESGSDFVENEDYYVCAKCNLSIKKGLVPKLSYYNGMKFPVIPNELNITSKEASLISLRLCFQNLHILPKGCQLALYGNVICVPSIIETSVCSLPRYINAEGTVSVRLKRRLAYKSVYRHMNVRPEAVMIALRWLIQNSSLYKDRNINIDYDWLDKTIREIGSRGDCFQCERNEDNNVVVEKENDEETNMLKSDNGEVDDSCRNRLSK